MLKTGVVTRSFQGYTIEACAEIMAALGFFSTELCFNFVDADYWRYNGRREMTSLSAALASRAVKAFRDKGIDIVAIGVFSNLMEPDPAERDEIFAVYQHYINIAADNGVPFISTENGFIPGRRGINADSYEHDFNYFCDNMKRLLDMSEKCDVSVAFEPCVLDLVPSAKRAKDLITQIGSKKLKILLDPANLIANSSEEDMFKYLSGEIAYIHGKDRRVNDAYGRNLGEGDIDWVKFFSLYQEHAGGIPFILEYVNKDNCVAVRDRANKFFENVI